MLLSLGHYNKAFGLFLSATAGNFVAIRSVGHGREGNEVLGGSWLGLLRILSCQMKFLETSDISSISLHFNHCLLAGFMTNVQALLRKGWQLNSSSISHPKPSWTKISPRSSRACDTLHISFFL